MPIHVLAGPPPRSIHGPSCGIFAEVGREAEGSALVKDLVELLVGVALAFGIHLR